MKLRVIETVMPSPDPQLQMLETKMNALLDMLESLRLAMLACPASFEPDLNAVVAKGRDMFADLHSERERIRSQRRYHDDQAQVARVYLK